MAGWTGFPKQFFSSWPKGFFLPETAPTGCEAVLEDGGKGIGPETLGGTWYPFVQPSNDIRHILADACLTLPASANYQHPLRVVWLAGVNAFFGGCSTTLPGAPVGEPGGNIAAFDSGIVLPTYTRTNGADVVIYDAANQVVFDSTTTNLYVGSHYGPRLYVHQWTLADRVLRITQHTAFANLDIAYQVPATIAPARAVLDERVTLYEPLGVLGFQIDNNATIVKGDVNFQFGFNTTTLPTKAPVDPLTRYSAMLLSATPNTGAGRAPAKCDQQTVSVSSLAQVAPDQYGNFRLTGDPCYWVRPIITLGANTATVTPNQLQIGNDCSACCECSDYAAVGMGLNYVFGKFQSTGSQAETTRDSLTAGIQRWNGLANQQLPVSIQAQFLAHHVQYLEGVIQVCNASANCLPEAILNVVITLTQTGVDNPTIKYILVPQTVFISNLCGDMLPCPFLDDQTANNNSPDPGYLVYTLDGNNNPSTWNVTFWKVQPRSQVKVRFRLQFIGLDLAKTTSAHFTCSVTNVSWPTTASFTATIV